MPAPKKAPSKEQLSDYLARRLTQQQMVETYFEETGIELSRSAFAMAMHRSGLTNAAPPRHSDLLPWTLRPEHRYHRDARYLRIESRRRRGEALTDPERRRLQAWLEELDDRSAVIHYDPDSPGGWWLVERTEDDDDLIRRPESLIPASWEVLPEHESHPDYALLQLEVRRRRGEDLSSDERETLRRGLAELDAENLAITYDQSNGFSRIRAAEDDRDYVARAYYCPACGSRRYSAPGGTCPTCHGQLSRVLGIA